MRDNDWGMVGWLVDGYRGHSGRMICRHEYPARWAGLRDDAPLALPALGQLEAEIQQDMKELEGMLK